MFSRNFISFSSFSAFFLLHFFPLISCIDLTTESPACTLLLIFLRRLLLQIINWESNKNGFIYTVWFFPFYLQSNGRVTLDVINSSHLNFNPLLKPSIVLNSTVWKINLDFRFFSVLLRKFEYRKWWTKVGFITVWHSKFLKAQTIQKKVSFNSISFILFLQ